MFPNFFPATSREQLNPADYPGSRTRIRQRDDEAFFSTTWPKLVESYTSADLTHETDRLVAFSGVARASASERQRDRYLAGLWESQMLVQLLWTRKANGLVTQDRHIPPVRGMCSAPSWSWASARGPVEYGGFARSCYFGACRPGWSPTWDLAGLALVQDISIKHAGPDPFGSVNSASMDLFVFPIPVRLDRNITSDDDSLARVAVTVPIVGEISTCWERTLSCGVNSLQLDTDEESLPKGIFYLVPLIAFLDARGPWIQGLVVQNVSDTAKVSATTTSSAVLAARRIGTFRDNADDDTLGKFIVHTLSSSRQGQSAQQSVKPAGLEELDKPAALQEEDKPATAEKVQPATFEETQLAASEEEVKPEAPEEETEPAVSEEEAELAAPEEDDKTTGHTSDVAKHLNKIVGDDARSQWQTQLAEAKEQSQINYPLDSVERLWGEWTTLNLI